MPMSDAFLLVAHVGLTGKELFGWVSSVLVTKPPSWKPDPS